MKSLVYGGLDGTVNSLAVILGGIAGRTSIYSIMTIGVSVMIGDGLEWVWGIFYQQKVKNSSLKLNRREKFGKFRTNSRTKSKKLSIFINKTHILKNKQGN